MAAEGLRFGRRIIVPDVLLALGELAVIGYPLYDSYTLDDAQRRVFLQSAPIAILLAGAVWYLAMRAWLSPLLRAARRRLAGEVLDPPLVAAIRISLLAGGEDAVEKPIAEVLDRGFDVTDPDEIESHLDAARRVHLRATR